MAVRSTSTERRAKATAVAEAIWQASIDGRSLKKTIHGVASAHSLYQEPAHLLAKNVSLYYQGLKSLSRRLQASELIPQDKALEAAYDLVPQSKALFAKIRDLLYRGALFTMFIMWRKVKSQVVIFVAELESMNSTVTLLLIILTPHTIPDDQRQSYLDQLRDNSSTIPDLSDGPLEDHQTWPNSAINKSNSRLSALTMSNDTLSSPSSLDRAEDAKSPSGRASSLPETYANGDQIVRDDGASRQGDHVITNIDQVLLDKAYDQESVKILNNYLSNKTKYKNSARSSSSLHEISRAARYEVSPGNNDVDKKTEVASLSNKESSVLRPAIDIVCTKSESANCSSPGNLPTSATQMNDSRWDFQDDGKLPPPRKFSGVRKLYRVGSVSSVPLGLSSVPLALINALNSLHIDTYGIKPVAVSNTALDHPKSFSVLEQADVLALRAQKITSDPLKGNNKVLAPVLSGIPELPTGATLEEIDPNSDHVAFRESTNQDPDRVRPPTKKLEPVLPAKAEVGAQCKKRRAGKAKARLTEEQYYITFH